jgi:hypothetical protein
MAQMRERNSPAADVIEAEIEEYMAGLTVVEPDGSFEYTTRYGETCNPAVIALLRERYARPDGTGWDLAFHEPDLIQLTPQKSSSR